MEVVALLIEAAATSMPSEVALVAALQCGGTRPAVAVAVGVLHWKVVEIGLKGEINKANVPQLKMHFLSKFFGL